MGKFLDWLVGPPAVTRADTPPTLEARGAPVSEPLRIPRRSDLPLSDAAFLRTIAVYRSVQVLTMGAAQLSVDVWRGADLIERPSLVKRPDVKLRDLAAFTKRTVASLAVTGNAYWQIDRNARNEAANLTVLNPHECEPLKDGTLAVGGRQTPLSAFEFQHLGLLWVPGESRALGPIQAARVELAGAAHTVQYGAAFHTTGDVPSGVLKSDQVLTPATAEFYKAQWMQREAREVAVLGQGLDYKPVLLAPKDAQFIESRGFDVTAIARLFGIPAHMALASVEGSSLTYQNLQQADLAFVRWTLAAYLNEIEQALTAVLPSTQTARFNLDALLRPDTLSRYQAHAAGITAGWLLKSEVRDIEGLLPVAGIDDTPAPMEVPA